MHHISLCDQIQRFLRIIAFEKPIPIHVTQHKRVRIHRGHSGESELEVADATALVHVAHKFRGSLRGILIKECHTNRPVVFERQWKREIHERVEGHRHLLALRAHNGGLQLSLEPVHDDGVVARAVIVPLLIRYLTL